MVKGNGGKSNNLPHSRPTKAVIRHLPHNLTRATQQQLNKQIHAYLSLSAVGPDHPRKNDSRHPHRTHHLYRPRTYRARLYDAFDIASATQAAKPKSAPEVPQLYGKHYKAPRPQPSDREKDEPPAVRITNWKITAIVPGKPGTAKKPPRPSCAYIELRSEEQARVFCSVLDGREFTIVPPVEREKKKEAAGGDEEEEREEGQGEGEERAKEVDTAIDEEEAEDKAVSTNCVCETTTTRDKRRKPLKVNRDVGKLEEDSHFLEFIENMEKDKSIKLPSAEVAFEAEQAEAVEGNPETDATMKPTTLGKYLEEKLRDSKSSKWKKKPKAKASGRASKKSKADKQKKSEKAKSGQAVKEGAKKGKAAGDKTAGNTGKRENFRKKKSKAKQSGRSAAKPAANTSAKPSAKGKRSNKRRKNTNQGNAQGAANSNHQTRNSTPAQS